MLKTSSTYSGHILCITDGLTGLLNSSFELLRRLEAVGYRTTCASPKEIKDDVMAQGFDFVQLDSSNKAEHAKEDSKLPWWIRLRTINQRRNKAVEALRVSCFPDIVKKINPDLILIDIELHEYIIIAATLEKPIALISPFMSIWKRHKLPPLHRNNIPGIGWKGSLIGIELSWMKYRFKKRFRALKEKIKSFGIDRISIFRRYARHCKFPFGKCIELNQWLIPFTYRSIPIICLHAIEFEFPHQPRPEVFYAGPMIHLERKDHKTSAETNAELENIFFRRQDSPKNRRIIFGGFGSFFFIKEHFLLRIFEAFKNRPNWDFILAVGETFETDLLDLSPPNVHLFSWIPQLRVLQHADAAIVHGGINTIDECIHFEVPMLVYSGKHNDMEGNAARVVYHGLGLIGNRKRDDSNTICRQLDQLLANKSIKKNIHQFRNHERKYLYENRLEDFVDQLLKPRL